MPDHPVATALHTLSLPGSGPEDLLPCADGTCLTGLQDGRILRIDASFQRSETVLHLPGRPLGLEHLADGGVLICDGITGLLRADLNSGETQALLTHLDGQPLGLCNNAAVARDGTIYFSDSSLRHPLSRAHRDICDGRPSGRVIRLRPDGAAEAIARGLYFANGVVLAPDESHLLVAETGAARVQRIWLTGPQTGRAEVFLDGLPGLPDNLNIGADGRVWMAMVTGADAVRRLWSAPYPLRWLIGRLPQGWTEAKTSDLRLRAFDFDGRTHYDLHLSQAPMGRLTSVRQTREFLYLGSNVGQVAGRVPLAALRCDPVR